MSWTVILLTFMLARVGYAYCFIVDHHCAACLRFVGVLVFIGKASLNVIYRACSAARAALWRFRPITGSKPLEISDLCSLAFERA